MTKAEYITYIILSGSHPGCRYDIRGRARKTTAASTAPPKFKLSIPSGKMSSPAVNAPLRSAILRSSRFHCCVTPFSSTPAFPQQTPQTKNTVLKRSITGLSTKRPVEHKNESIEGIARTQTVLQRVAAPTNSRLSPQFIITSIKRNFSESADLRAASPQTESDTISKKDAKAVLDWNTFFKLRASRRRYSLVSSVLTSLTSTAVGAQVLSVQDIDTLGAQVMGLDPFIVLGLATAACGALGWLVGPVLGNSLWGVVNRQYRSGVAIVSSLKSNSFLFVTN